MPRQPHAAGPDDGRHARAARCDSLRGGLRASWPGARQVRLQPVRAPLRRPAAGGRRGPALAGPGTTLGKRIKRRWDERFIVIHPDDRRPPAVRPGVPRRRRTSGSSRPRSALGRSRSRRPGRETCRDPPCHRRGRPPPSDQVSTCSVPAMPSLPPFAREPHAQAGADRSTPAQRHRQYLPDEILLPPGQPAPLTGGR
jgi:hypothetical protein